MPISTPTTQPKQSALYARQLPEKEADNLRALERFFNQEATTIASGDRGEAMELGPSGLASFRNLSIFAPAVLPRLKADPDNDAYEQEADQVAENIVESTSAAPENAAPAAPTPVIQRQEAEPEEREEEEEETRQAKAQPGKVIDINGKNLPHIRQLQGKGQQLPNELQAFFQPHFGIDLSQVRIHYDSGANAAAKAINARAFTVGRDVVFDAGQFNPHDRESRKLLAHELAHVAQQSRSGFGEAGVLPVQRKGGTWGGFWRNIGRAIWSIFGDEKAFDDKEIEDYLDYLKKGEIEDDYISDDKARAVVRRWQAGKLELTRPLKVLLIREMFSGPTLNADENAILDILNGSPGERTYLLNKIKPDEFREEFHGREKDELEKILTAWEERTGKVTPLNLDPTDTIRYSKTRILGDDAFLKAAKSLMGVAGISIPPYEGMTVQEFDLYIRRQADWFVEPSIQNDATARDQLWEIAAF
ncbi:MAG: DUF4157 domain-containing protein, partial [Lewinellaceae bacterium]|nr:DUF4157 domain-containing protein [Lewinellaceae bacterium]